MMATVIRMPEVLANTSEAAVLSWMVEPDQVVSVGTPLAEIETEKAVVEYASEAEGTVLRLIAEPGQTLPVGEPIAILGAPGEDVGAWGPETADAAAASPPNAGAGEIRAFTTVGTADGGDQVPADTETSEDAAVTDSRADSAADRRSADSSDIGGVDVSAAGQPDGNRSRADAGSRLFASPIVRQLARSHAIDLAGITGTGPNGRIVRRDLDPSLRYPRVPTPDDVPPAPPEAVHEPADAAAARDVPLTRMRRAIARRLTESKSTVPHFYLRADVRVDALLALRADINDGIDDPGLRVSVNDLVVKAVAAAYVKVPDANVTWGGDRLHRHDVVDVAVAVSVDGGLLTPVLRGVERLTLTQVRRQTVDLADRARRGRLHQQEIDGGTVTVSNLGMYGVQEFAAILNPPQSAILAVGAVRTAAVVSDGVLTAANVMTVTLSADHRALDGVLAARWMQAFVAGAERPVRLLV